MRSAVLAFILGVAASAAVFSQTYLISAAKLVDRTTRQSITLTQPSTQTSAVRLIFPPVAGAANQALYVSSVSGNDVTLSWSNTSSATSTTSSARVTTAQTGSTTPAGLTVTGLAANRAYRYLAAISINRAANNDNFRITVTAPTGTTFLSMGIRAGTYATTGGASPAPITTGGLPFYTSTTSATSLTSNDINPNGATLDVSAYWYIVEGIVVAGSSAGDVTVTAIREATPTADNVNINLDSNLSVSEIQ